MTDQPRYTITREAAKAWIVEHGLDPDDVLSVRLDLTGWHIGRPVQMAVLLLRRDELGAPQVDRDQHGALVRCHHGAGRPSTENRAVPVRSFPELTPYVGDRADE